MDINTLIAEARLAADALAVVASAEARIRKGEAKLAWDAVILTWQDPQAEKDFGRNADLRAARLAADTGDLAAAYREAERAAIYADANKRQAAIRADPVAQQVRIAAMLTRV